MPNEHKFWYNSRKEITNMKLFNLKPTPTTDKLEKSLYDHFMQSKDVLTQIGCDEKSVKQRMLECFPRTVFDMKYDTVSYDKAGNRHVKSSYAFDESVREAAKKDAENKSAFRVSPQGGDIINDTVWAHYGNDTYIGWSACAILAQNPIIHLACHIPAEDAIARGYKLAFADHEDADASGDGKPDNDLLTAVKKATEKMGINDVCVKLNYNKRVFGFGVSFPIIYDKSGKPYDMSKPFNPDGLKGMDYRGFKVVDPYWLTPQFEEGATRDPLNERFMEPTWYKLPDGRVVHHTWFIKVNNAEVADILKPTYYYGGMPLTQMIYKRVWCAEKTANEAPLLAMSKRMLVVDANVQQIIKNKSYVYKLMQVITKCRNNWGVFFKSPTSNIQQIDTSLTDFEECMFSQFQLVASIAQMPATKLLQTTPKGFNSTGEFEWKIYAQLQQTVQNRDYKPQIEKHIEILTATQGKHRVMTVTFNPVDAPSEKERADIENTKANTRTSYVQNGILTPEEVRDVMRNDEDGEYTSIPVENPDLEKQKEIEEIIRKVDGDDGGAEA